MVASSHDYAQIVREIGEWSLRNFGQQAVPKSRRSISDSATGWDTTKYMVSAHCETPLVHSDDPAIPQLGALASLMGIGEELGELASSKTLEDTYDSIADALVYIGDFCCRIGCPAPELPSQFAKTGENRSDLDSRLLKHYGRLLHAILKRCQGIRGYVVDSHFCSEVELELREIIDGLGHYLQYAKLAVGDTSDTSLLTVVSATWDHVSQRDWTKNKETGGQ